VGSALVDRLQLARLNATLRLGSRRGSVCRANQRDVEVMAADVRDEASLLRFCQGCDVVVNCAGPSRHVLDAVARAALAVRVDYVDVGGDETLVSLLADVDAAALGWRCVLSAGFLPGLSALLPRVLAGSFDVTDSLLVYVGVRDCFSPSAAEDYLAGMLGSEAQAGWRDGVRVPRVAHRKTSLELPLFGERVTAQPYFNAEAERVAKALHLRHAQWFNVFETEHVLNALTRLASTAASPTSAVKALQSAAELDLAGRAPHQTFLLELSGSRAGRPGTESLLLRSDAASHSVAAMACLATLAVLGERVPYGLHYAAEVIDAKAAFEGLARDSNFPICAQLSGALHDVQQVCGEVA
jgi:short subunit dehydrogenase-like uncharacterized protein